MFIYDIFVECHIIRSLLGKGAVESVIELGFVFLLLD